ncbi:PrgI family protein [Candidatus Gottesmanbacteria bacterium]|nr:PrgI family protein [Candidatus Gottesmanbacteria bacterium]
MEQHPIPRNISGFQFHLVGDMTLKQFGYLAGGAIIAYLLYKLPFPQLITFPLAGTSFLSGLAFAFLPIQERPLDRWLVSFIKSIYSPTQYLWHKENPPLDILIHSFRAKIQKIPASQIINHQLARDRLNAYLKTVPPSLENKISMNEKAYIDKTLSLFGTPIPTAPPQSKPITQPPKTTTPPPSKLQNGEKIAFAKGTPLPPKLKPVTITEDKKEQPKKDTVAPPVQVSIPNKTHPDEKASFLDLEAKLNELLREKERLTEELIKLKQEKPAISAVKPVDVKPPPPPAATVKRLSPQTIKDVAGMPSIPTVPNLVLGVIRDNLGHLLPGIIVTVKDLSGMPVRAIKTNKLGQFASATPLQNGEYLIEVEDPQKRYTFDVIDIVLNGEVFMPIEITAKGQREIMRDKLTKELFNQTVM